ncbi:cation:proton antiporter [Aureliella helgolandensis]|uniref:Na(+)/H(+) antiporter NhaP n=1 Tax=Aureliella helgolandensis TaxID=2527968 RepID=A0A518FZQ3_9BACT|nr:sodium:proton antiporter [Aureliella helgolandensis]QDV21835.1 Na(+)/H(+) antiporter NhaP [Aureliella helgolandensis]
MDLYSIAAIIVTLAAMFGYINVKFLKLPNTIGLMVIAILFTFTLFASTLFTNQLLERAEHLIAQIDFHDVLLDVMLGFLLFAGALHTNFSQLKVHRWPILVFSTVGVIGSSFLIGGLIYFAFPWIGLSVSFIHCLLFGALISPTDPIAVLGILKQAKVPKQLETKIVGESLFNDGVGVVVFMTVLQAAHGLTGAPTMEVASDSPMVAVSQSEVVPEPHSVDSPLPAATVAELTENHAADEHAADTHATGWTGVVKLFVVEVFGGIILGLLLGLATYKLLKSIDDYEIEILITLACVMGGYALASYFHFSAPLAIVVAGLCVGNDTVRGTAMSKQTEEYVDRFWELVDMLMNATLFVLIGLELLVLTLNIQVLYASLLAVVVVLLSRYLSLLLPVRFFRRKLDFAPHTTLLMTWAGLRGGISIALALSLPISMNRELFLAVTYGVVVFSIIVQGLSVGWLARKLIGQPATVSPPVL